ncbi:acetyltransferase [Chryseobacterium soli]|uniref:Acetyltransferase n=1 Tax=Chryseobacterium soli TaxID=445961 RepID=A0A086A9M4_9FLAO|nr:acetyltransferase [Chryseobacterium soli]KFF13388.1 acetyltransferase [Chryseobacterium soli]MDV7697273.1 acetyltransferase [Chryseobacterium soli]
MLERYGIFGIISLLYFKIRGMLIFKNARLIRFPFRIRGRKFIKVGKGFTTGFNCRIDAFPSDSKEKYLIEIGEGVQMNDYVHIAAHRKVVIKDNVLIASKVFITDHNHGSYSGEDQDSPLSKPSERKLQSSPVTIEENVWLGEYVSIMPGVTIGKGSIIGTMSVVTKDIPDYTIAVGSPAKVIKKFNFSTNTWDKV